jgi:translation elongation factor EF-Ts
VSSALIPVWRSVSEEAQKDLRKRGVVLAAKKSSRTAAEGLLAMAQDEKRAAVVELNCETDFVARNDVFQYLVRLIPSYTIYIIYLTVMLNRLSVLEGRLP